MNLLARYAHWLHLRWPAGTVEKLPEVGPGYSTSRPGILITGDLTGVPLLKFALDSGARAVQRVAGELGPATRNADRLDLVIIGAGVSGLAAAVEARRLGLSYAVLEAVVPFATLVNFPRGKPIFTYPRDMEPAGALRVTARVKEALIEELNDQVRAAGIEITPGRATRISGSDGAFRVEREEGEPLPARKVIVAIGRSGNFRRLNVPGEDLDKVYNRLHDPRDFCGQEVLVVGGGDSALETAIALGRCGCRVTLSYRKTEFTRAKPENVAMLERLVADPSTHDVHVNEPSSERVTTAVDDFVGDPPAPGRVTLELGSRVREIRPDSVVLVTQEGERTIPNQAVFSMIGREPPLEFFRRNGIRLVGEMSARSWLMLGLFVTFCVWLYNWKSGGFFGKLAHEQGWFPTNLPSSFREFAPEVPNLWQTLLISASGPAFWYTLAYSLVVVLFGIRRIRRRRTPYVTRQTWTLMGVQVLPLFLLPEVVLPYLNYHGWLPAGLADALFPAVDYGHGREFWRAYGLILAWPLNVYNIFTAEPLWTWIGIGVVQTLVLIPLGIRFFGKGVYCGWICSCGALAETLGDTHRHKMPHGPRWNRWNMLGQAVLLIAVLLLGLRIVSWAFPEAESVRFWTELLAHGEGAGHLGPAGTVFRLFNYKWFVDVTLAGVLGYGLYFWFSGRMWCRFACPLAALMHIYARFSRFAIIPEKKKCISCNVCTSVCHQGIDIMNFANKGLPMQDPECVRCSACVQSCPTGVLRFGQVDARGTVVAEDRWPASPVRMREGRLEGGIPGSVAGKPPPRG